MQQISVFLENRSGQLAQITDALSKNNINLRALNIAETKEYGLLRLITDDPAKTVEILLENGNLVTKNEVVAVSVPDQVGGLNGVLSVIAEAGMDVEYMYSTFGTVNGQAIMIFRVADPAALIEVLSKKGISTVTE